MENQEGPPKRLLHPIPEARELLGGISHTTFYRLVRDGEIHLVKLRNRSFVTDAELKRLANIGVAA